MTLGATESKVLRLLNALEKIAARAPGSQSARASQGVSPAGPERVRGASPGRLFRGVRDLALVAEHHGLNQALIGRVSADLVVPYPPGFPS